MKSFIVVTLLFSFLFVAVFGFLAMTGDMHNMAQCFAVALQGRECLQSASALALAGFNLDVLKLFSTAVLISFFLISFILLSFVSPFVLLFSSISQGKRASFAEIAFLPLQKQMKWFERTFHSPPSFLGR